MKSEPGAAGESAASPKYLLGVPMTEPPFMKPAGRAGERERQSNKSQHQTPPRFQKQHQLALQQQQQQQLTENEESSTGNQGKRLFYSLHVYCRALQNFSKSGFNLKAYFILLRNTRKFKTAVNEQLHIEYIV